MQRYIVQLRGMISVQQWQLTFTQSSDEMAKEHVLRALRIDPCVAAAMTADLFNADSDKHIASWRIKKIVTMEEVK
jgi:hypothetical protein